ncbi:hypothetical protein [Streptomyces sp. NPDC002132]|uniref:SCO4402 family protein n=1 Tax=unclassified Streptomyces TaxID=2593676 RepID=UPI00332A97F3
MSFARGSTGAELLKTSVLAEDAVAELGLVSAKAQVMANHHVHVVPVVLALANPPWQRDVWLDPSGFENIDHVFHTLFDDFCDADEPERFLGISLRTEEEVTLMRALGVALNAAAAEAPLDTDAGYLQAPAWPEVVAIAGRLAQVMVSNDLRLLSCGQHA